MEYWTFEDVVLDEDQDYPEGQALVCGTYKEAEEFAAKRKYKKYKIVKMKLSGTEFVREDEEI
jgi:hypothetical protein